MSGSAKVVPSWLDGLDHVAVPTKDILGKPNGILIPIYNEFDRFQNVSIQQIYATICSPGMSKGPHLHKKRWGYFTCIRGNVRIVVKFFGGYTVVHSGEDYNYRTVEVPPGVPCRIDNLGKVDAVIINATSPAWAQNDQDDYVVEGWDYD